MEAGAAARASLARDVDRFSRGVELRTHLLSEADRNHAAWTADLAALQPQIVDKSAALEALRGPLARPPRRRSRGDA